MRKKKTEISTTTYRKPTVIIKKDRAIIFVMHDNMRYKIDLTLEEFDDLYDAMDRQYTTASNKFSYFIMLFSITAAIIIGLCSCGASLIL